MFLPFSVTARGWEWREIPSTRVTDNEANRIEITIPPGEMVAAEQLRFVFPHDTGEMIRIKEIAISGMDEDRARTSRTCRLER